MNKKFIIISIASIIVLNLIVFGKVKDFDFVNYDDYTLLVNNNFVKNPTYENIKGMLIGTPYNYHPLVFISYTIEHGLFGLDPSVFHVTNLIIHILNCILVLFLVFLLTENPVTSIIIALFFSLHPMQVESVAWISERKGLLCAFFYLLSLISYILYSKKGKRKFYVLSFVLFVLAFLAKAISITLPIILILYDYYAENLNRKKLVEKIPFFVFTLIFTLLASIIFKQVGGVRKLEGFNFMLGFYNIGFYFTKLIAPLKLSAHYEYPISFTPGSFEFIVSLIMAALLIVYAIKFRKIERSINFGIIFFIVILLPTLRFIPISSSLAADRYVYMPIIGILFASVHLVKEATVNKESIRKALIVAASLYLIVLTVSSYKRCATWKNSYVLWTNLLKDYPNSGYAIMGLGGHYMSKKDYKNARKFYLQVVNITGGRQEALYNIGASYINENDLNNARSYFSTLIAEFPDTRYADAYMYLGNIADVSNDIEMAIKYYEQSLRIKPKSAWTHYNYGLALENHGRIDNAIEHYKLADLYDNAGWGLPWKALERLGVKRMSR